MRGKIQNCMAAAWIPKVIPKFILVPEAAILLASTKKYMRSKAKQIDKRSMIVSSSKCIKSSCKYLRKSLYPGCINRWIEAIALYIIAFCGVPVR